MDIVFFLDKILTICAEKYLGKMRLPHDLLNEAGFADDRKLGFFIIEILIDDGFLKPNLEAYTSTPLLSITPKGFRFIAMGGYKAQSESHTADLRKQQEKMRLELVDLKWGFRISIASLLVSLAALAMSYYK